MHVHHVYFISQALTNLTRGYILGFFITVIKCIRCFHLCYYFT